MISATRRPRRRWSSACGTGAPEAECDIEHRGERRERIPLQRVAAMPLDAGVGALPLPDEPVGSVARLLDHEGLERPPEALFLAREHQVLAQSAGALLRTELEKSRAGDHGFALDRLNASGRR